MKKAAYLALLALFLSSCSSLCSARHFELRGSGEGPENHFGVALSLPYEGSDARYGRILQNQGYDVGASWFIVSHWDTPLSWAEMQKHTNPSGEPVFSGDALEAKVGWGVTGRRHSLGRAAACRNAADQKDGD